MTDYYIGTAGWSYKDWEGIVYPTKKGANFHALIFLAQYINVVEINSTFYRPPAIRMSWSWIKRVDSYPDFLFTVKLHQVFTHQRKGFSQTDVNEFITGIEPLRTHNRLAAILIQFPWSFARNTLHVQRHAGEGVSSLHRCCEGCAQIGAQVPSGARGRAVRIEIGVR